MSDLTVSWQNILRDAITRPGSIHEAYSRFHNYSIGNQLLALFQCSARGIQPGPIATFMRWKELGRHVCKGEKALTLCMPVTCIVLDVREFVRHVGSLHPTGGAASESTHLQVPPGRPHSNAPSSASPYRKNRTASRSTALTFPAASSTAHERVVTEPTAEQVP
jgi:hypothetical protein